MKKKPLVERAYEAGRRAAIKSDPTHAPVEWDFVTSRSKAGFKAMVNYVKAHPKDK